MRGQTITCAAMQGEVLGARHSTRPHRHSRAGGKPQGGDSRARQTVIADLIRNPEGRGDAGETRQHNHQSPSPLMGEESKVRVKTMLIHRHVIAGLIRNPEG